ncbi:MAG TPA: hypothetical protein VNJ01_00720 [Bacteriovoracaceae bacterium]|nr:hypothetical protein [Bacteriovoracaceae bacterium]
MKFDKCKVSFDLQPGISQESFTGPREFFSPRDAEKSYNVGLRYGYLQNKIPYQVGLNFEGKRLRISTAEASYLVKSNNSGKEFEVLKHPVISKVSMSCQEVGFEEVFSILLKINDTKKEEFDILSDCQPEVQIVEGSGELSSVELPDGATRIDGGVETSFVTKVGDKISVKSEKIDLRLTKEFDWLKVKTPNPKGNAFADPAVERGYLDFLNHFGLSDTIERRVRYLKIDFEPFSVRELNFLSLIGSKNLNSKVASSQATPTKSVPSVVGKNAAKTMEVQEIPQEKGKAIRIRSSGGKPSFVSARYWITADIATNLRNTEGLNYSDVVMYFDKVGFRDLKSNKSLSDSQLEMSYKGVNNFTDLTPADIEQIKGYSSQLHSARETLLIDLVKKGHDIASIEQELLAKGFSEEQIAEAKNVSHPRYKEAYVKGQLFKNSIQTHLKDRPATLAKLLAEKEFGFISEEDFNKEYTQEEALINKYKEKVRKDWEANMRSVMAMDDLPSVRAQMQKMDVGTLDEKSVRLEVDKIIGQFGSFKEWEKHLAEVEIKYKYRPLARPLEGALNLAKGVPGAFASVIKAVDVAREFIPETNLVFSPLDVFNVSQKIRLENAQEGNFYQFGTSVINYVEQLKPANRDFDGEFMVTVVPQALSQLGVTIAAGALTGGTAVPLLLGAAQGGTGQYDEAVAMNATKDQRKIAAFVGALIGTTDAIPVGRFIKPLTATQKLGFYQKYLGNIFLQAKKVAGDDVALAVTKRIWAREILRGSLVEGKQELTEKKVNDFVAKLTYDSKREILTISDADIQTFFAGAIGGAAGGQFRISMQQLRTPQTQAFSLELNNQMRLLRNSAVFTTPTITSSPYQAKAIKYQPRVEQIKAMQAQGKSKEEIDAAIQKLYLDAGEDYHAISSALLSDMRKSSDQLKGKLIADPKKGVNGSALKFPKVKQLYNADEVYANAALNDEQKLALGKKKTKGNQGIVVSDEELMLGIVEAHKVAPQKKVFQLTFSEIRGRQKALMKRGWTKASANILIRSGIAGTATEISPTSWTTEVRTIKAHFSDLLGAKGIQAQDWQNKILSREDLTHFLGPVRRAMDKNLAALDGLRKLQKTGLDPATSKLLQEFIDKVSLQGAELDKLLKAERPTLGSAWLILYEVGHLSATIERLLSQDVKVPTSVILNYWTEQREMPISPDSVKRITEAFKDGILPWPTDVDLTLRDLNRMATANIGPIGVVTQTIHVDGRDMDAVEFMDHDVAHMRNMPTFKNASEVKLWSSLLAFADKERGADGHLQAALHAYLFKLYHEDTERNLKNQVSIDSSSLISILKYSVSPANILDLLKTQDYWGEPLLKTPSGVQDKKYLDDARDLLIKELSDKGSSLFSNEKKP